MGNAILGEPVTAGASSRSKTVFKNKKNTLLKFKLNHYIDLTQSMLRQVPADTIARILDKFRPYSPVLSGQSSMLRTIYSDKYFAIQHPDYQNQENHSMYIFISCFNIDPALCKTYLIEGYSVHLTSIKGAAKLYGPELLDPASNILQPMYALRNSYRPDRSQYQKNLLFALCISARLKLLRKSNAMDLNVFYSKAINQLSNIQSAADQLVACLTQHLSVQNSSMSAQENTSRVKKTGKGPSLTIGEQTIPASLPE